MSDVRQEQGDPIGASILDRRHSAVDASARQSVEDATPPVDEQVDKVFSRLIPLDQLKLSLIGAAKGDLDAAQAAYAWIGGDDVPEHLTTPTMSADGARLSAFGIAEGNLDVAKAIADWVLGD